MAKFVYAARNSAGKKIEGTIEASDRRTALIELEKQALIPVSLVESSVAVQDEIKKSLKKHFSLQVKRERMTLREVLLFTTELSDLLASGMTLGNALNSLAHRQTGGVSDKIIADLRDAIIRGMSLSDALELHKTSFSNLYISMIRAGEAGGALNEILARLVTHYERVQETKEKIIMALVYPLIVLALGVATVVFSMLKIVPKFKVVFDSIGQSLPLPTRILMGTSDWFIRYGWLAAVFVALVCVLIASFLKTDRGKKIWHTILLKAPLIKGVVASGIYSNFARTLGTLLSNGVPVLQALKITETTVGNVIIAEEIKKARERVTDGTTISRPLAAGKAFPRAMIDMLEVGEQSGDMVRALNHIACRYENELNRNIKILTTALEPILIVLVALSVGFVAISILMAVFSMTNGLNV